MNSIAVSAGIVVCFVVKVKNPMAINLLFLEAYHNYIKCLYPCANTDATVLAGILMQINHGDFDPTKPVTVGLMYDICSRVLISRCSIVQCFIETDNRLSIVDDGCEAGLRVAVE